LKNSGRREVDSAEKPTYLPIEKEEVEMDKDKDKDPLAKLERTREAETNLEGESDADSQAIAESAEDGGRRKEASFYREMAVVVYADGATNMGRERSLAAN
jgi:hypothetical protein